MLEEGQFPSPFPVTRSNTQTYGSVFGIGAAFGALPAGTVAKIFGRCKSMVIFELFMCLGWLFLTIPRAVWMLIVGRILQGIGVGALCAVIPSYVGEISQASVRGNLQSTFIYILAISTPCLFSIVYLISLYYNIFRHILFNILSLTIILKLFISLAIINPSFRHFTRGLGSMFQGLTVVGIMFAYVAGAFLPYVFFNAACCVWAVSHIVGVLLIPESPYYFLSKNMDDKAALALKKLRGTNADTTQELAEIKKASEEQTRSEKMSFFEVMSSKVNRRALYIGVGCMFFQQASGINVVVFYMTGIFEDTGSNINPKKAAIIVSAVQLLMTFITMLVIDKAGRRKLLIFSGVMMGISHIILAHYYFHYERNPLLSESIAWIPLVSIAMFISAFALGFGPIPWVVMGEIFSNEVKPYGTSIATAINWLLVFLVTYSAEYLAKIVGNGGTFLIFGLFCWIAAVFSLVLVPETQNRTLAEIQKELAEK
ncbi:facilitated trehalose transporter Tret1-like isoform X1 [Daktulosphaira vitifoliae]|uniref:facilitated trehalose transporter Tret1-like isoform X1 n=1 Tax=Daktulosphaira vitifoliae TaxID=58002 RepID=UPI0021AAEF35|nr:facilitated trehalose transporter Tret1-like isoform X1 [Daktulosphaira vitifoliae]